VTALVLTVVTLTLAALLLARIVGTALVRLLEARQ